MYFEECARARTRRGSDPATTLVSLAVQRVAVILGVSMRSSVFLLALVLIAGCDARRDPNASTALPPTLTAQEIEPGLFARPIAEERPATTPDLRRTFVLRAPGERYLGVALAARRFRGGALVVRDTGDLAFVGPLGDERTLASDVGPELAIDERRGLAAYVRGENGEHVVERLDGASLERVRVAGPFHDAGRVAFVGEGLVFVASDRGGIAGLYHLRAADGLAVARRLTNVGMRAGAKLPPEFVPLPIRGDVITEHAGCVRYCDGEALFSVDLETGRARAEGPCGAER